MKGDNIKLSKITILVSTFRTFDNRDKALICIRQQKRTPPNNQGGVGRQQQQALICLPALLHNNAM